MSFTHVENGVPGVPATCCLLSLWQARPYASAALFEELGVDVVAELGVDVTEELGVDPLVLLEVSGLP